MPLIPPPHAADPYRQSRRIESWSRYWASGALHSCAGSFDGNYAGALRGFWLEVFAGLPAAPAVLDLCCGNAPLSKLLVDHGDALARGGVIDAVDLAEIAPPWHAALAEALRQRVRLHPRVDAALLPFDAASFDLVMSQYGIEYVGEPALAEALRVLRPGGRLAALVHHPEALPVRIAREELEHLDWLQHEVMIDRLVEALIEPMARAATPAGQASLRADAVANDLRAQFNGVLQRLQARSEAAAYPDALLEARDALMGVLHSARHAGQAAAGVALAAWREGQEASRLRQQELVEHALEESRLAAWAAMFADPAPQWRRLEFDNGELAGWAVLLHKPGG
jgi:SAM-dependent methyltransferase